MSSGGSALSPKLDLAKPLPHMVDFFGITVRLEPRAE